MVDRVTAERKDAHLELCASGDVEPAENSTLLDCVRLAHCAMPELALSEIALDAELFGKKLKAPLVVTGMTGGTARSGEVNRDLAAVAEEHGVAFGVGSQRAMAEDAARAASYQVREVAPSVVLIGNIGLTQAVKLGRDGVRRLADAIRADGMAVHLNAGQELTQPEGDRDFRGGYALLSELVEVFGPRLLVKETGCGISPDVARRLVEVGVRNLDVSGLGGTSWVRVEQLRADGAAARIGAQFSSWGIPTAAAVLLARRAVGPAPTLIASGGIRNGLEAARALAIGADLVGMALPLFRAQQEGGRKAASQALQEVVAALRQALLLTGSRSVRDLRRRTYVITGELKDWAAAL